MQVLLATAMVAGAVTSSIAFTTVARGTLSGIGEPREVVVRAQPDWTTLWEEHAPGLPPPAVDFSRQTILGLFAGTRPTAGYELTIESIERADAAVVVSYRASRPPSDAVTAQVITSPFHLVAVPRFEGHARFERLDAHAAR